MLGLKYEVPESPKFNPNEKYQETLYNKLLHKLAVDMAASGAIDEWIRRDCQ
jgi:hypothetical protein